MTAQIRLIWNKLNSNYWFYPAIFSVFAAILALTLVWVDRNGFADWLSTIDWLVPATPEGANNQLSIIAASMIGVASTVFSITIAAVAYASGNYGPRLLTNFMEDKGNQLSLATFIGTFVYALVVLRSVRVSDDAVANVSNGAATALPGFVPQLSLLVAAALMAISIGVLVFFLNHIPASIRINTVLEGIGRRLLNDIDKIYPDKGQKSPQSSPPLKEQAGIISHVQAEITGYVQLIAFDELSEAANDAQCHLELCVRTGDFVHPEMKLVKVHGVELSDELRAKIIDCFSFGATRTAEQDLQFLIDELAEIALRALSPGINDPITAITAIHWLGSAMASLGTRDLQKRVSETNENEDDRVQPVPDDFDHYLSRGFENIRSGVATSPPAALVMLDTLRNIAVPIKSLERRELLAREGINLVEQARTCLTGPDLKRVETRYQEFAVEILAH